jgi:hypothetical protein
MAIVIKLTPLPTGGLFKSPSFGGSVANASAPRVSIIMFTQSNCTAVRGTDPESDVENCHYSDIAKINIMVFHAEKKKEKMKKRELHNPTYQRYMQKQN